MTDEKKKYIFVLCPPYQGSTIIVNLLSSSKKVSSLLDTKIWAGESQWLLKEHGDTLYETETHRWDPNYKLNMDIVNEIFNIYLDHEKTFFVEKSPPTICRAIMFEEYFSKIGYVYFIISIRNPYSTRDSGDEWVKFAKYQQNNVKLLKNTIITNYEEICLDLDKVIKKIQDKIPELNDIYNNENVNKPNERYKLIHSNKVDRIIDKNEKNKILKNHQELLDFFGYKLIE
jgi:hypothetical protein